jgi:hypothetical protein
MRWPSGACGGSIAGKLPICLSCKRRMLACSLFLFVIFTMYSIFFLVAPDSLCHPSHFCEFVSALGALQTFLNSCEFCVVSVFSLWRQPFNSFLAMRISSLFPNSFFCVPFCRGYNEASSVEMCSPLISELEIKEYVSIVVCASVSETRGRI